MGKTDPTLAAKIAPANDARMAPMTNAISFTLTVLMPIASATVLVLTDGHPGAPERANARGATTDVDGDWRRRTARGRRPPAGRCP